MLVSVVVPAYNEEKYLGRCLGALAQQRHAGFDVEVIVVDNGSTDHTADLARSYGVRVLIEPRRGVAWARQIGFEAARGEIIASTDADSAPPPGWLEALVNALTDEPWAVAVHGPIRVLDGSRWEDLGMCYLAGAAMALSAGFGRPTFSGPNFAVWRRAWAQAGGFDTAWESAEDVNLSLKLARIGRVLFRWHIQVPSSGRRRQQGIPSAIGHTITDYARVVWLGMPPLPFEDYR